MNKLNNMPTDVDNWTRLKKNKPIKKKLVDSLNIFQYRYRLARSFSSMTIDGATARTVKGYTAFMKLFLAFSAYEEVKSAEIILLKLDKFEFHKIKNQATLVSALRNNEKLKDLLINGIESEKSGLKKVLKKFYEGESDDIMCIATAARNSFAHGNLTVGGAGLSVNSEFAVINKLANVLNDFSDTLFSKCIAEIERD